VTKIIHSHVLEVQIHSLAVVSDDCVDPFVCVLRVNLLGPDNACKHLDTPGVLENSLNLVDLHSKGITEAALNAKRYFIQEVVAFRNPFVCDVNHR